MLKMIEKYVRIFHKSSDMALVVWNISLFNTSIPSSYITDTPDADILAGEAIRQRISSHSISIFFPKYSIFSTKRIKLIW